MKERILNLKSKMIVKQIVLFIVLLIVSISVLLLLITIVCNISNKIKDNSSFICVETTKTWKIVYHKETKVMYAVSSSLNNEGVFTLLVDADGKPMIWED